MAAAQDDAREKRLVDLFNLERPENRVRHGVDAVLRFEGVDYDFELKSATTKNKNISTVRDLGPGHIAKWRTKHWIMSFFENDKLLYCQYGSPDAMRPWIEEKWNYIKADFQMAAHVPQHITLETMYEIIGKKETYTLEDARRLHKNQMSAQQYQDKMDVEGGYSSLCMLEIFRDRASYVLKRGSTLNNPHISGTYLANWPKIDKDHASELRRLVKTWQATRLPKSP